MSWRPLARRLLPFFLRWRWNYCPDCHCRDYCPRRDGRVRRQAKRYRIVETATGARLEVLRQGRWTFGCEYDDQTWPGSARAICERRRWDGAVLEIRNRDRGTVGSPW